MQKAKKDITASEADIKKTAKRLQINLNFIRDFRNKHKGFLSCEIVRKDIILATNSLCVDFVGSVYDFTLTILLLS
jgi:hypothetical protein